ncbi:hypothetical protein [Bradyrhizobium sp.]|uniref:hypothetical protein n=1 Tax=Bradyrhizobium sp. TaxID=376 RepID=UPI002D51FCBC|nr:hypothetical protein [Bradyrhizobium sp.]HZR74191.1 hypothetical protein [Bradyrhizobium sp.]
MADEFCVRLLNLDVTELDPTLWKWVISERGIEVSRGYAASRESAKSDGNIALFALLSIVP